MTEWFPVVFFTFKIIVLGIGMYFAVKWHYEQGKKKNNGKEMDRRALVRAGAKVAAVFVVSLAGLALLTYVLMETFGLESLMTLP